MTKLTAIKAFQRKIDAYCELRFSTTFSGDQAEALKAYMRRLIERRCGPPRTGDRTEWDVVARVTGIDAGLLASHHRSIDPGFDAIIRWNKDGGKTAGDTEEASRKPGTATRAIKASAENTKPTIKSAPPKTARPQLALAVHNPSVNVEFPEPMFGEWDDPADFAAALRLHMRRHGETYWVLYRSIVRADEPMDNNTLLSWIEGRRVPRSTDSFDVLGRIERRYRLPEGYFKAKLPHQFRFARSIARICTDVICLSCVNATMALSRHHTPMPAGGGVIPPISSTWGARSLLMRSRISAGVSSAVPLTQSPTGCFQGVNQPNLQSFRRRESWFVPVPFP